MGPAGNRRLPFVPFPGIMFTSGWQIFSAVLYIMNLFLAVYAATSMIMRRQDPVKTLTWVTVLILLPYFGLVLYFFFGMHYRKKRLYYFAHRKYRVRVRSALPRTDSAGNIP
mgnify:CR=1 FL=1